MKTAFDSTKFKAGVAAYVSKNSEEFSVLYKSNTGIPNMPFTATIKAPNGGEDYTLVSQLGKLNSGEELYMKAAAGTGGTHAGTIKGFINIYKDGDGEVRVGTRLHSTPAKATQKASEAKYPETLATGVPVSW